MELIDRKHESTIVSFLPFTFVVPLPAMSPANVIVNGVKEDAELDDFEVSYVQDGKAYIYQLDGKSLTSDRRSEEIAGAIVFDYIAASQQTTDDAFPGLKALPGKLTKEQIKKAFAEELAELLECHKRWLQRLVIDADDTWKNPDTKGKSRVISDLARYASKRLGLNKEWVNNARVDHMKCPACTSFIPEEAIVCPMCKTVLKPKEYNERFKAAGL